MVNWGSWLPGLADDPEPEPSDDPISRTLGYMRAQAQGAVQGAVQGVTSTVGEIGQGLEAPASALASSALGRGIAQLPEAGRRTVEAADPLFSGPARTLPTREDPLAPAREVGQYIAENPLQVLPAVQYGQIQGAGTGYLGRELAAETGDPDAPSGIDVTLPGGYRIAPTRGDVGGFAGQAVLDPLNYAGAGEAALAGRRVLPAIARGIPGVEIAEGLTRGAGALARRVGAGAAEDVLPEGAQLLGGGLVPRGPDIVARHREATAELAAAAERLRAADEAVVAAERSGSNEAVRAADRAYGGVRAEYDAASRALEQLRPAIQAHEAAVEGAGYGQRAERVGFADAAAAVPANMRVGEAVSPFEHTAPTADRISLNAGVGPEAGPGLRAAASNFAQGALFGAATEPGAAQLEGRESDPNEALRRALIGGGLGLVAGSSTGRKLGGDVSRLLDGRGLARRAAGELGGGMMPERGLAPRTAPLTGEVLSSRELARRAPTASGTLISPAGTPQAEAWALYHQLPELERLADQAPPGSAERRAALRRLNEADNRLSAITEDLDNAIDERSSAAQEMDSSYRDLRSRGRFTAEMSVEEAVGPILDELDDLRAQRAEYPPSYRRTVRTTPEDRASFAREGLGEVVVEPPQAQRTHPAAADEDVGGWFDQVVGPRREKGQDVQQLGGGFVPDDEVERLARRAAETPPEQIKTEAGRTAQNVGKEITRQIDAGVAPERPREPMAPPGASPGWYDWAEAWRYGWGLFAQLSTAAVQAVGPLADVALGIPTEIIERGILKGRPGQLLPIAREAIGALPDAVRAAGRTARGQVNPRVVEAGDYRPGLAQRYAERGEPGKAMAANVVEAPGRIATQAPDSFWYELFYRTGLAQAAGDESARTGQSMRELLANPTDAMIDAAHAAAREATYKGELGAALGAPEKLMRKGPTAWRAMMSHLMPVYHTIARIHEEALPYVPGLGALPLEKAGLRAAGRTPQRVIAQQAVGASLVGSAFAYAAAGGIRGPGPENPNEAEAMRNQGYTPNTINVGGFWVPTSWFGKAGPILNEVAAVNDAMLYDKGDKAWGSLGWQQRINRLIHNSGRAMRDYPTLEAASSVGAFFGNDPSSAFGQVLGEGLAQYVPGPIRTAATWRDPYNRTRDRGEDVPIGQTIVDTARQRSGIGREDLPRAQDILGRDVENPRAGPSALLPNIRGEKPDPVIQLFLDSDVTIGDPPKQLSVARLKAGTEMPELTHEEQRRWNALRGKALADMVKGAVSDPAFKEAPLETRQKWLEKQKAAAAAYAHRTLAGEIGDAEVGRRLDEANARKKVAS